MTTHGETRWPSQDPAERRGQAQRGRERERGALPLQGEPARGRGAARRALADGTRAARRVAVPGYRNVSIAVASSAVIVLYIVCNVLAV